MTEAEWRVCIDPQAMLKPFPRRGSVRQGRLIAVACCRRAAQFMDSATQPARNEFLNAIERRADEPFPNNWVDAVVGDIEFAEAHAHIEGCAKLIECFWIIQYAGLAACLQSALDAAEEGGAQREAEQQAGLIHCIVGNLFRPVAFDPAWRTSDVRALAQGIYDDRAFDRLPILADALQDAGCDNDDVLTHSRAATVHARGCWVVDAVLEKA